LVLAQVTPPITQGKRFSILENQWLVGRWNKKLKLRIYRGLTDPAVDNCEAADHGGADCGGVER
jgi:hypothetical protein